MHNHNIHHSFDIELATELGDIELATLIHHFQFWILVNKRQGINQHEGRTWTFQTLKQMAAHFPYWSMYKIERLLEKLVKMKIIIKGNFNKSAYDRTVWYAFENQEKFTISRFREMDIAESRNGNCGIATPIPDNNTYNNKDNKEREADASTPPLSSKKVKKEVDKIFYRENVSLSLEEYEKLLTQYGQVKLDWMFDYLDAKKGSNGMKYVSDYHVLLPANWVNTEYEKQKKEGKIKGMSQNPSPNQNNQTEIAKRIHALCDFIEDKLGQRFSSMIFFQAGPTKAVLCNKHKDFNKEYEYEMYEFEEFKQIIIKDL